MGATSLTVRTTTDAIVERQGLDCESLRVRTTTDEKNDGTGPSGAGANDGGNQAAANGQALADNNASRGMMRASFVVRVNANKSCTISMVSPRRIWKD